MFAHDLGSMGLGVMESEEKGAEIGGMGGLFLQECVPKSLLASVNLHAAQARTPSPTL